MARKARADSRRTVAVPLTPDEYKTIEDGANEFGLPLGTFVRLIVLLSLKKSDPKLLLAGAVSVGGDKPSE